MAFPTTPVLTTFPGADEDPLSEGGLWAASTVRVDTATIDRCQLVNNRAVRASVVTAAGESLWAASFAADQEVFVTMAEHAAVGFGLYARIQNEGTSSVVAYHLSINDANGFRFFRLSNTTFTQIGSAIAQAIATGDSMGLSVSGTTLEAWHKPAAGSWTLLGSETNANISGAGKIGITIGANAATDLDDFGGGEIVVSSDQGLAWIRA